MVVERTASRNEDPGRLRGANLSIRFFQNVRNNLQARGDVRINYSVKTLVGISIRPLQRMVGHG